MLATELADLLIADGVTAAMTPTIEAMWSQIALALPPVEPAVQQELRAYFNGGFSAMLLAMLEPLRTTTLPAFADDIAAALDPDEMRTAIAFYGSPAGQSFANIARQVRQILLFEPFGRSSARAAGYGIVNDVLRAKGLALLDLPDELVALAPHGPLTMTDAADAARVLVSATPETMDAVARSQAIEFVGLFIEEVWELLPADPAVEDEIYRALDASMEAYYIDVGR